MKALSILLLIILSYSNGLAQTSEVEAAQLAANRAEQSFSDQRDKVLTAKNQLAAAKAARANLAKIIADQEKAINEAPSVSTAWYKPNARIVDPKVAAELETNRKTLREVDASIAEAETLGQIGNTQLTQAATLSRMRATDVGDTKTMVQNFADQFKKSENLTKEMGALRLRLKESKEELEIMQRVIDKSVIGMYVEQKLARLAANLCEASRKCGKEGVTLNDLMKEPNGAAPRTTTPAAAK